MPTLSSLSPEEARRFSKQILPTADDPEPVEEVMELSTTGEEIPIRMYAPVVFEHPYCQSLGVDLIVSCLDQDDHKLVLLTVVRSRLR